MRGRWPATVDLVVFWGAATGGRINDFVAFTLLGQRHRVLCHSRTVVIWRRFETFPLTTTAALWSVCASTETGTIFETERWTARPSRTHPEGAGCPPRRGSSAPTTSLPCCRSVISICSVYSWGGEVRPAVTVAVLLLFPRGLDPDSDVT